MVRIVVGGQINKQEICAFTKEFCGSAATVDVKNDLDAAMAMQMGQYDYYIGACNTGGGGALALAMALLGAGICQTISMPGKMLQRHLLMNSIHNVIRYRVQLHL